MLTRCQTYFEELSHSWNYLFVSIVSSAGNENISTTNEFYAFCNKLLSLYCLCCCLTAYLNGIWIHPIGTIHNPLFHKCKIEVR